MVEDQSVGDIITPSIEGETADRPSPTLEFSPHHDVWTRGLSFWGAVVFEDLVSKAYKTTGRQYMSKAQANFEAIARQDPVVIRSESEIGEACRQRARFEAKKEALKNTLRTALTVVVVGLWLTAPISVLATAEVAFGGSVRIAPLSLGIGLFLAPLLLYPLWKRLFLLVIFDDDLRALWVTITGLFILVGTVLSATITVRSRSFRAGHAGQLDLSWWIASSGGAAWLLAGLALVLGLFAITVLIWWLTERWERANPGATVTVNLLSSAALCNDWDMHLFDSRRRASEYLVRSAEIVELSMPRLYGAVASPAPATHWAQELGAGLRVAAQEVFVPTAADRERVRGTLIEALTASADGRWGDLPRKEVSSPSPTSRASRFLRAVRSVVVATIPAIIYGLARGFDWVSGTAANYAGAVVLLWAGVKLVTSFDPEAGKTLSLVQEVRGLLRFPTSESSGQKPK